jgi:hypothetical protein
MSQYDDGGMSHGGSISVVDQLQLQKELSAENDALQAEIDALRRGQENWKREKAYMSAQLQLENRTLPIKNAALLGNIDALIGRRNSEPKRRLI